MKKLIRRYRKHLFRNNVVVIVLLVLAIPVSTLMYKCFVAAVQFKFENDIKNAGSYITKYDPLLKQAGVEMTSWPYSPICRSGPFSVSSPCEMSRNSKVINSVSEDFTQNWKAHAGQLHSELLKDGWKAFKPIPPQHPAEELDDLIFTGDSVYGSEYLYRRSVSGADCELLFRFGAVFMTATNPGNFSVSEMCYEQ